MESILQSAAMLDKKETKTAENFKPKICVVGAGGAGCNTINRLTKVGIKGADLIAVNTDQQHLNMMPEPVKRVLIGQSITRGLGAGGFPKIGTKAAEVSRADIENVLDGVDLVFLAAGMGGGTGTGASPIISRIAREQGAIVIAMVTYPFALERVRLNIADEGIDELKKAVDTLIVIDNNKLAEIVPNLPLDQAFSVADEITARAVRGITETITVPSLLNIDYADVRAVMTNGGVSMIAVGEGKGNNRVQEAVENTLHNRLLDVDYSGATGVLLHVTGGAEMSLGEVTKIGELLTQRVDPKASVTLGARADPTYENKIEIIAIFTGIKSPYVLGPSTKRTTNKKDSADVEYLR